MDPQKLLEIAEQHLDIREAKSRGKPDPDRLPFNKDPKEIFKQDIELTPKLRPCSDCGDLVSGRTVLYSVKMNYYSHKREKGWIKKCLVCKQISPVSHPLDP